MLDVLKALFRVMVAGLLRFLGVTRKQPSNLPPGMAAQYAHAQKQVNNVVVQIVQEDGPFTPQEIQLIRAVTEMEAGLVDRDNITARPAYTFNNDMTVGIEFVALTSAGEKMKVVNQIGISQLPLTNRPFLTRYLLGLRDARQEAEHDQED